MSQPLAGLKVLDFSALLPGPYATLMLADLGAEVLRVESPSRPDLVRFVPPFVHGTSTSHAYLNRNKETLALDLKQPGAVARVLELVTEFDIVVEQFRPGVMARLGVGYEILSGVNPRLIYCSITGYGQTGPFRDRAGHDINYLAVSGVAGNSGRVVEGPPPLGVQIADLGGGSLHAVVAILAAVIERQRSGLGQHIDISMTDCVFALNALSAAALVGAGEVQTPERGPLNGGTFYDYYRTADGRHVAVGSLEPKFLLRVCTGLGCPELAPLGASAKPEDQLRLRSALAAAFVQEPLVAWRELFVDEGCCVDPVLTLEEAVGSPLSEARAWIVNVPVGAGVSVRQPALPIKFSRSAPVYRKTGS